MEPDLQRRQAFDIYFASIKSMANHPGTTRDAAQPKEISECAEEAYRMLLLRDEMVERGLI